MNKAQANKLRSVIGKIIQHSNFNNSDRPVDIDNWTSLNHLRITLEINEQFGANFDPSDISMFDELEKLINKLS